MLICTVLVEYLGSATSDEYSDEDFGEGDAPLLVGEVVEIKAC